MGKTELINVVERIHTSLECQDNVVLEKALSTLSRALRDQAGKYFIEGLRLAVNAYRIYDKGALAPDIVSLLGKASERFDAAQRLNDKNPDLDYLLLSETSRIEGFITQLSNSTHNAIDMLARLQESLEGDPDDFIKNFRRAQLLYTLEQYGEAKIALLKAISLDREHYRPYYVLGNVYMTERDFPRAIYYFSKSLQRLPNGNPALNNLGIAHYFSGEYDKAERCFRDGERRDIEDFFFPGNLGFMLFRKCLRVGGEEEVLTHFDQIMGLYDKAIAGPHFGANPHFNRSYLLYLAEKHGRDFKVLRKERAVDSFSKTRELFQKAESKIGILVCTYFISKCESRRKENPQEKLLDRLLFDVNNFMTEMEEIAKLQYSFLQRKNYVVSDLDVNHLCVLKRWRPDVHPVPKLLRESGGGYFFRWGGTGVVINPGRNFIGNFRSQGYVVSDIDAIIVTNEHPNYCSDLEPILTLVQELNDYVRDHEPEGGTHRIKVFLNWNITPRFGKLCGKSEIIESITSLRPDQKVHVGPRISLNSTFVYTKNETGEVCESYEDLGLKFSLKNGKHSTVLGFLNNSCYSEELPPVFRCCDILVVSVGRLFFRELLSSEADERFLSDLERYLSTLSIGKLKCLGFRNWQDFRTVRSLISSAPGTRISNSYSATDLGFLGTLDLLKNSKARICVLTNLAYELGNERKKIAEVLDEEYKDIKVLTGEIGLRVRLEDLFVFCEHESRYRPPKDIREISPENADRSIGHASGKWKRDKQIGESQSIPG